MKADPMYPVQVQGTRTILRDFRPDDVHESLAIVGDDAVTRWLSFASKSLEEARAMIEGAIERAQQEPRNEYYLAVTLPQTGRMIGFARLGLDGVKAAKLGYAIRATEWGHGYATDATRALTHFGFTKLGLHRISATIGPDNAPSIVIAERLGFALEGTIRDHVFTNDAWRDSLLYSVLEHEWDYSAATQTAA